MRDFKGKRYWLIGASEGLGEALALKMSAAGAELILSARDETKLNEIVESLPQKARALACDVGSEASVEAAVSQLGEIDGAVYLAGVYWPMPSTEWQSAQATKMVDINLTGAMRTLGPVVEEFVKRDQGHVVITGSLVGFRGLPRSIGYTAAKAGLMTLAECMYYDLKNTGVSVQMVNPGYIKTRLTDKNKFKMPMIMEPEAAAEIMFQHMKTDRFSKSFPWPLSTLFRIGPLLPSWLYYRLY